jgi:hypothetical protein
VTSGVPYCSTIESCIADAGHWKSGPSKVTTNDVSSHPGQDAG